MNIGIFYVDPPQIEMPKENLKVILGEIAMIECIVKGFPLPEISWMKNDVKLESTSTYYYINEKGSLHFYSIKEEDTANYTCIAVNEAGSANSSVSLTVLSKVNFLYYIAYKIMKLKFQ